MQHLISEEKAKLTFDTIIHTMLRGQRALLFSEEKESTKNNEAWNWEHHGVGCFSALKLAHFM